MGGWQATGATGVCVDLGAHKTQSERNGESGKDGWRVYDMQGTGSDGKKEREGWKKWEAMM